MIAQQQRVLGIRAGTKRQQKKTAKRLSFSVLALPIFPGRLQPSIVSRSELNFRVRDGNGWTLALISTNLLPCLQESKQRKLPLFLSLPPCNSKYYIRFPLSCQALL